MTLPSPLWPAITTVAILAVAGCAATTTSTTSATPQGATSGAVAAGASAPRVVATSPESAGEYLTIAGGCNDCHTPRWAETNGNVPPADRFTGSPVGYHGPWGTSYAANLRLVTQRMTEDRWVHILTTADDGKGAPPMPWMNFRFMNDQDIRAMYRYIRSLGPKGDRMPRGLPAGQTPTGPYIEFSVRQGGM